MLLLDVMHKPVRRVFVHALSIYAADIADVPHVVIHGGCFVSETSECIDNDTEYDVEEQQNDDHKEAQIVYNSQEVDLFRIVKVAIRGECITDSTTISETEIKHLYVTMKHASTYVITRLILVELNIIV
ncbi:MAG: hypothetical protein ACK56I_22830, partial [bacterium]